MDGDLVAIIAITCGTALLWRMVEPAKAVLLRIFSHGREEATSADIQALITEVRQLRQQNNDLILAMDTTLDRVDRRLGFVESRLQLGPGESRTQEEPGRLTVGTR
jgi:hypothetical protein